MTITKESERVLNEHRIVQDLADRLHGKVAVAPRGDVKRWVGEVRDEFERFRAHLLHHMAFEERDGYLVNPAHHRAGLEPRLTRLRHEHREIELLLRDLHDRIGQMESDDLLLARDWCNRVIDTLHYVQHHENEENDLIELVFTQDIGSKD